MAEQTTLRIPDLGGATGTVIELAVAVGDTVAVDDTLVTLEGDKATMDIPAPMAGTVVSIACAVGDTLNEGAPYMILSTAAAEQATADAQQPVAPPEDVASDVVATVAPDAEQRSEQQVHVPDLGGASGTVVEVAVAVGDTVAVDDTLVTLEGDKATMDIPAPVAGTVVSVDCAVGDALAEGAPCVTLSVVGTTEPTTTATAVHAPTPDNAAAPVAPTEPSVATVVVDVPDVGGASDVTVVEVAVAVGDSVAEEATLITLEGDKATMDIPSPHAGVVEAVHIAVGDRVSMGGHVVTLTVQGAQAAPAPAPGVAAATSVPPVSSPVAPPPTPAPPITPPVPRGGPVYAGPSVRRLALDFGVDLSQVPGTGRKGRILKQDLASFVKQRLNTPGAGAAPLPWPLSSIEPLPAVDFSRWGPTEVVTLGKIKQLTAKNMQRAWSTVPQVTQHEWADITAMEAFRQAHKHEAKAAGFRLTATVFVLKALAATLSEFPAFRASLVEGGETMVVKHYVHLGVAVDTPKGLVVAVVRDVDQKPLADVSREVVALSEKARTRGLSLTEMQGACMTVSSLGGVGGSFFSPIVNPPEVAILGVSRAEHRPVWDGEAWQPRLMLPLSLSYDHRVIDGAEGARFVVDLSQRLQSFEALLGEHWLGEPSPVEQGDP